MKRNGKWTLVGCDKSLMYIVNPIPTTDKFYSIFTHSQNENSDIFK